MEFNAITDRLLEHSDIGISVCQTVLFQHSHDRLIFIMRIPIPAMIVFILKWLNPEITIFPVPHEIKPSVPRSVFWHCLCGCLTALWVGQYTNGLDWYTVSAWWTQNCHWGMTHHWPQHTNFTNPIMHLSHIPQYTTLEQKCAHFCSKVVYCGMWDRCIFYLIFMPQIVLYFLRSTSVVSFHIDIVLTLSIESVCLANLNIDRGWLIYSAIHESCNTLWSLWPVGIHSIFQGPLTASCKLPAISAVQGDCERVYQWGWPQVCNHRRKQGLWFHEPSNLHGWQGWLTFWYPIQYKDCLSTCRNSHNGNPHTINSIYGWR